ncbi:MAG: hypothetical protein ACTH0V_00290 [Microbacteriaceae bacterium]
MKDCAAPEDVIAVFMEVMPGVPFPGIVLLGVAVVLMTVEGLLTFRFGGVPDGLIGAIGVVFGGIGVLIWAGNWPTGCTGTVQLVGWIVIGIAVLVAAILFLFWRARRHDGGMLMRGYGDEGFGGRGW